MARGGHGTDAGFMEASEMEREFSVEAKRGDKGENCEIDISRAIKFRSNAECVANKWPVIFLSSTFVLLPNDLCA